jgi:hypothetical protein
MSSGDAIQGASAGRQPPDPASAHPESDVGAETTSRFAYQWSYAAVLATALFDDASDVVEVFCEHHEDILLKHKDGKFSGLQVKTRDSHLALWEATDPTIVAALSKFVGLECTFPGHFRGFILATNHFFYSESKTRANLRHVLTLAAPSSTTIPLKLRPLVNAVAAAAQQPPAVVVQVLRKVNCRDDLCKKHEAKKTVTAAIADIPGNADVSYSTLQLMADLLAAECGRASGLDHKQCLPVYFAVIPPNDGDLARRTIEGKRFDKNRVSQVLANATQQSLLAGGPVSLPITGSGTEKLEHKLGMGGFTVVSVNSAKDLRDKAQHHSLRWIAKLGETRGLERHTHIRSLVLRDCSAAIEQTKTASGAFGIQMRDALRRIFRERRESDGAPLFDCLDEHLEGYAYSLTGECQVLWSLTAPPAQGNV